ncbi:uncharacterized protein LOC113385732 [Ctenocephalides felis]|uniref:uncharacterized protein LOC113385726 n=1 Tax=Ctenocephalides felis TaxID=7515 RepID=UPI000E6E4308|nr:uncharacterized protein LOC113385726 [Ctenocephalides felis]XP_026479356.1 uncharacterized protein LOC113385732 [Ctenocephalides felis]
MKLIEKEGDEGMKIILEDMIKRSRRVAWIMQSMMTFTSGVFGIYLFGLTFIFREPGEGIHPFCAETWFPFIDKNNVWIPFSLYFYACIMDAILMPQWNVMVMVLMIYATSMIKILRHKLQHRDAFASQLKLGSINESTTCRGSYNFIVDRIEGFGFDLFFTIGFLQSQVFCALLYYWHANETTVQSEDLATDIYESQWIDDSKAYKNAVSLMIQRAQRLIIFQAGLFPMNLQTYIMAFENGKDMS